MFRMQSEAGGAGRAPDDAPAGAIPPRLAFGQVAELYDQSRPSYPRAVIDDVIEAAGLRPPARILEVGAGTGKATLLFAERGIGVVALEPSPEMAEVARARCAPHPGVEIVGSEFESWSASELFPALVSAASWHWIDPALRYELAARALRAGGTLAAIWTFPDWEHCDLRGALADDYRAGAPQMAPDFPMHPASEPTTLAGDWRAEIESSRAFTEPTVSAYSWSQRYASDGYARLLQTHQDHILLSAPVRGRLLAEIAAEIEAAAGGVITLPLVTRVCLARRR
jgi:SAM-dependent methyltransferase